MTLTGCLPDKIPLRNCVDCRWCGHCLLQDQAKFPYMNPIEGKPAWWWAGYNSAGEARAAGFVPAGEEQDYQAIGESAQKPQPTSPPLVKPAPAPAKARTLRGGIKLIS